MPEAVSFANEGLTLRGILHRPRGDTTRGGVLLLHGWGGYRVGPHGILRSAAERLAEEGYVSLRFDFRGRGDSEGDVEEHDLNSMIEDAEAATGFMRAELGCEKVYLAGICSGGEVAVGAMHDGLQVDGAALWSSPVFSAEATFSRKAKKSASYLKDYLLKVFRPQTWRKLLSGRIRFGIIRRVLFGGSTHRKKEGERAEIGREEALKGGCSRLLLVYGANERRSAGRRRSRAVAVACYSSTAPRTRSRPRRSRAIPACSSGPAPRSSSTASPARTTVSTQPPGTRRWLTTRPGGR